MQGLKTVRVRARGTSLVLKLEDSQGMREPKIFTISTTAPTAIPMDFAHSLFLNGAALAWIKEGKLVILEGADELNKVGTENGFIEEPIKPANPDMLLNIILGKNMTKIKELFSGDQASIAFELAGQNKDQLTQGAIDIIEDTVGISLSA